VVRQVCSLGRARGLDTTALGADESCAGSVVRGCLLVSVVPTLKVLEIAARSSQDVVDMLSAST
jgi:hypothetical protein